MFRHVILVLLIHVEKRIQVEHGQRELASRLVLQETRRQEPFPWALGAARRQPVGQIDLLRGSGPASVFNRSAKRLGLLVGKVAIQQLQRLRSVRAGFAARAAQLSVRLRRRPP